MSASSGHDGQLCTQAMVDVVRHFQRLALEHGKEVTGLIHKSDNCQEQFKSRHTVASWFTASALLSSPFDSEDHRINYNSGFPITKVWGTAGHGKAECDAVGGIGFKCLLLDAVKRKKLQITDPKTCVDYVVKLKSKVKKKFWLIDSDRYQELKALKNTPAPAIKGIQDYQLCLIDVKNVDKKWEDCRFSFSNLLTDDRSKWSSKSINLGTDFSKVDRFVYDEETYDNFDNIK